MCQIKIEAKSRNRMNAKKTTLSNFHHHQNCRNNYKKIKKKKFEPINNNQEHMRATKHQQKILTEFHFQFQNERVGNVEQNAKH